MPIAKSYHHGNLRETLLQTSLSLIKNNGVQSFTLREVARLSGVSHTAPYRHFRNKEQIVEALVSASFDRIANRITYYSLKGHSPVECLELGTLAYLRFALDRPDEFRLILSLQPGSSALLQRPLASIQALVAACGFPKLDLERSSRVLLANIHGIAELSTRQQAGLQSRKDAMDFAGQSTRLLIAGLKSSK
jgi:AcrR family transcriptional regulator